jgi:hypothetical protein
MTATLLQSSSHPTGGSRAEVVLEQTTRGVLPECCGVAVRLHFTGWQKCDPNAPPGGATVLTKGEMPRRWREMADRADAVEQSAGGHAKAVAIDPD